MKMSAFKIELVFLSFLVFAVFGNAQFVGIQPATTTNLDAAFEALTKSNTPMYRQFGEVFEQKYMNAARASAVTYSNVTTDILRMRSSICPEFSTSATVIRISGVYRKTGASFDSIGSSLPPLMNDVSSLMTVSFNYTTSKFEVVFRGNNTIDIETTQNVARLDPYYVQDCTGTAASSTACTHRGTLVHEKYGLILNSHAKVLFDVAAWMASRPASKVLFTGHSSGGALATLAAAYLTHVLNVADSRIELITFGAPAVIHKSNVMYYPTLDLNLRVSLCQDSFVGPNGHPTASSFEHVGIPITVEGNKNTITLMSKDAYSREKFLSWGFGNGLGVEESGVCANKAPINPVVPHVSLGNRIGYFYYCAPR